MTPTKTQVKIAKLTAAGLSQVKVAEKTGVHPNTVANILKKEDVKVLLEQEQLRLASFVPKAVKNIEHWVENATTTKDPQLIEIGYKATKDILQSQGLLADNPSHFSKVTINQQINIIPPIIADVLKKYASELHLDRTDDVIDVEYEAEGA